MSRHGYDTTGSPQRQPLSHHNSVYLPRTESLIEVRTLLKEHSDSSEFQSARKSDEELKQIKNKKLREFYRTQNELVSLFGFNFGLMLWELKCVIDIDFYSLTPRCLRK
jgi:hypothetical protein